MERESLEKEDHKILGIFLDLLLSAGCPPEKHHHDDHDANDCLNIFFLFPPLLRGDVRNEETVDWSRPKGTFSFQAERHDHQE